MRIIITLLLMSFLFGCTVEGSNEKVAEFIVEQGAERHEDVPGDYKIDAVLPKVMESVLNGEIINEAIEKEFWWMDEEVTEENNTSTDEGYAYPWVKVNYEVTNFDGICALNIFYEYTSAYGSDYPWIIIYSYYYDEYKGKVLSKEEYIEKLGYTQEDIMKIFDERYDGKYSNVPYKFHDIIFYFDKDKTLQFFTTHVDTYTE